MKPRYVLFSALLAAIVMTGAAPASAQQVCLTHDAAVTQLQQRFDETVAGRGLTGDGKAMFELFLSDTGSWTVVVSRPNGQSCVVGSGEGWQELKRLRGEAATLRTP